MPLIAKLVMVTAVVPVLCRLKLSALLLPVVTGVAKVSELGENVRVIDVVWPVPVRETLCGLPVALSVIEREAVRVPLADGVKVMLMEQDALTARVAGEDGHVLAEIE